MSLDTDETLWAQAGDGDHAAFGVVFERHVQRINNHCFRRVANWTLAEDLTSLVFLEAWKKRTQVHFVEASVLPWLLGVATNVCHNATRSRWRHRAALSRLEGSATETTANESDEVVDRMHAEAQAKQVLTQLSRLHQDDQELIHLSVWDGLGYDEIATALDIPVGTVKSRLSRARARLKANTTLDLTLEEEGA